MTKQEAIEILEEVKELDDTMYAYNPVYMNALDMTIEALKEVYQYREMDRKLRVAYGDCDGLLEVAINGLCKHSGIDIENPIKARLLTDEDVDKWENYLKIGTVEECRDALEKQKPKELVYESDSVFSNGFSHYRMGKCPMCDRYYNSSNEVNYCSKCGQALMNENLEGMEDE